MVYVYTPPGYESGKQKYPVLYLSLHGNGQIEASWTWTGRANVIMEQPPREDQTDGCGDALRPRAAGNQAGIQHAAPANDPAVIEKELLTAVKPLVEGKYRGARPPQPPRDRGIVDRRRPVMSIGLHNLDQFLAYIAAFSGGGIVRTGRKRTRQR